MSSERRVHIVDGDQSVHASLEPVLQSAGLTSSFYENPTSFLRNAAHPRTGCILLEVSWPLPKDDDLQSVIKRLRAILPVIVLIGQSGVQTAVQAMKAGAADFIVKPVDPEVLIASIETVLAKEPQLDVRAAARASHQLSSLTIRERQVLEGLLAGRLNKQIASDLGLSTRTVEVHRARMMKRLGARHLSEAIRLFLRANSFPIDQ
jgi:two-component system, LuxR family, response regulator FixJ